ncbi:hypothetical protein FD25_GL000481 [Levilactobacillus acidifarinae DSM 19394]|uniref:Uncharacterized protein n=2 Tax=Levilactobacillus acidifarinae TaxID=267364 RepID=A0A0R1LLW0_9LACO|nr:hypothetical protein FD25_GL000481 [Levilactobacillus acidifarinae DSM 19394]
MLNDLGGIHMKDTLTLIGLTLLLVALLSIVLLNYLIYPIIFLLIAVPCYFGEIAWSLWHRARVAKAAQQAAPTSHPSTSLQN